MEFLDLPVPVCAVPGLDPGFVPLGRFFRAYREGAEHPFALAVERGDGRISVCETALRSPEVRTEADRLYVDRLLKCLLWMWGGHRVTVCGSDAAWEQLRGAYGKEGTRAFDRDFMERIYERPFLVERSSFADRPRDTPGGQRLSGSLKGCRIGLDAGASNLKVSAVRDGETVYNGSFPWQPKTERDPSYHYAHVTQALRAAAEQLPRVDGVGISSAGVFVENRCMVASLFLGVSQNDFDRFCKDLYIRAVRDALGEHVPLAVANDGDVAALAGAMGLEDGALLGLSLGTSQAGGYVTGAGAVTGWLNELAFVPVDARVEAAIDPWSGDGGCGVNYLSQDAAIRLAPLAGLELEGSNPSERFRDLRGRMERGDEAAAAVYRTMGDYLGHALALYDLYYDIRRVLVMGGVAGGCGGDLMLSRARAVLGEYALDLPVEAPDDRVRQLGQSVAAAALR